MTREDCVRILDNIRDGVCPKNMTNGTIFFRDLVTDEVSMRNIYSESYIEVMIWLEREESSYMKMNIPFVSYIDGGLHDYNDTLFI